MACRHSSSVAARKLGSNSVWKGAEIILKYRLIEKTGRQDQAAARWSSERRELICSAYQPSERSECFLVCSCEMKSPTSVRVGTRAEPDGSEPG